MDDAFGYWFAGFVDGEGCFAISHRAGRPHYSCELTISLRDDDRAILDEIQRTLDLGRVSRKPIRLGDGANRMPQVRWSVVNKGDCLALVDLLDRYPLRAKKARDYAVWREAVREWAEVRPSGRYGGQHDWTVLAALKHRLELGRQYAV